MTGLAGESPGGATVVPEPPAEVIPPPCSYCGLRVTSGLCFSHINPDPDWSANNRAMCDFVHRSVVREAPLADPLSLIRRRAMQVEADHFEEAICRPGMMAADALAEET